MPLAAPTNFTATPYWIASDANPEFAHSAIRLTWDAVPGATGYRLTRGDETGSDPGDGYQQEFNVEPERTSYTDATVQAGGTYMYALQAFSDTENGPFAGTTPSLTTAPTGPDDTGCLSNVVTVGCSTLAALVDGTGVTFTWDRPGSAPMHWDLEYLPPGRTTWLQLQGAQGLTVRQYSINYVPPEGQQYRLRSYTGQQEQYSSLGPVSNLSAGCSGQSQTLSWDAVAGAEGYWIGWSDDGGATWDELDFGQSGHPHTTWTQNPDSISGPQGSAARLYRVKPVNETRSLFSAPWATVQCPSCA